MRCSRWLTACATALAVLSALPASADALDPFAYRPFTPAPERASFISSTLSAYRSPAELRGEDLSRGERSALLRGDIVSRPVTFKRHDLSFVGGVSYQLVRATPTEILEMLQGAENLPHALPYTKRALFVDGESWHQRIELVQGKGVLEGRYTVHVVREPGESTIRFWLDHERPHDVKDLWGYFRAESFGQGYSLVSVGVVVDVGPGVVRMLFEDKIQRAILKMPKHIRKFVEPRALAARQGSRTTL